VGFKLPIVRGPKLTKHSAISYAKSICRIVGLIPLFMKGDIRNALIFFAAWWLFAEILGIAEEWGATY
jgi:hypothetical protein